MSVSAALRIREATRDDVASVVGLFRSDTIGGHGDHMTGEGEANLAPYRAAFERIEASPDNRLFVCESDGAVVGSFQITVIPGLVGRGRTRAKIESVHVAEPRRGCGIGAFMMAHAIGEARAAGCQIVELSSNKQRPAAHRFYERLGFSRSHEGFKLMLS